jgi:hypothetical protein
MNESLTRCNEFVSIAHPQSVSHPKAQGIAHTSAAEAKAPSFCGGEEQCADVIPG